MEISLTAIKELRERTGAGLMDCKRALQEASGDLDVAHELLRQRGAVLAEKISNRGASEGMIEVYVHGEGRIGAMVEVNCETDFVARTKEFRELARNLAMQVTATNPRFVSPDEISPEEDVDPNDACLLLQPFIKDPDKIVRDLIAETTAKVGESIRVRRFARFELGK